MASRRSPETIPFRGFGVCTVQTHWSRPGAILTAYSMCRCSISSPEGCSWEPVALCKYRPSAPLWRRSVHNCSSFPDRAIVLGARHATYDTCQPIGWTIGGDPNPGASSHVALCADVASSGDNHFDRCDLLHHRIIHDSARKALAGLAHFSVATIKLTNKKLRRHGRRTRRPTAPSMKTWPVTEWRPWLFCGRRRRMPMLRDRTLSRWI